MSFVMSLNSLLCVAVGSLRVIHVPIEDDHE
jgi:hypothetical protein